MNELVLLTKQNYDPRQIEEDSFLDGGVLLLWCLKFNRTQILEHLLDANKQQFWRFAQLKTLVWACF